MTVDLTDADRRALDGSDGEAARLAMRLIVAVADAEGAERLIDISGAHIDGCLYHGLAGLEIR